MTDWNKFMDEFREKVRRKVELAASLGPQVVGDLYFTHNGEQMTPTRLYFAMGTNDCEPGECFTHYDNSLIPVFLCRNGERLVKPEWAELCASFKGGFIKDFYYE